MTARHPKGLPVLVFSEMWERFGFYVAQSLLVLYMTQAVGFSDGKAYAITGSFTALAYIMPLIGGFMADHVLGFRRAIVLGNILMAVGYGLLVTAYPLLFYVGLAFIVVGTGFFKPNVSSLLGMLYGPNDPRRESGFTIFYVGFNLGTLFATSSAGYIKEWLGWHASFGMACLGLIVGLMIFITGQKRLEGVGLAPPVTAQTAPLFRFLRHHAVVALVVAGLIVGAVALFMHERIAGWLFWFSAVGIGAALIVMAFRYEPVTRYKLFALLMLIAIATIYWAVYFQLFFSVNLFIDRNVNRQFGDFYIPTVMFISLESAFIFLIGPLLARLWQYASHAGRNPSVPFKFGLAVVVMGVGFLWLYLGIQTANAATGLTNPLWVVLAYLFITVGELLLSPIGLSVVTVLAPQNLAGMLMGLWFVSLGLGGNLAGVIAKLASVPETLSDPHLTAPYYAHAFLQYAGLAVAVGIIALLLTPIIKKLADLPRGV